MKELGLIGFPLSHSFSQKYFDSKFEAEGIKNYRYQLFPIKTIQELPDFLKAHPNLVGFNITIPYKVSVIPFLDDLDPASKKIGAVNTVRINKGKLSGFNTDVFGFKKSLETILEKHHSSALILGTGGASNAVAYVLEELGINWTKVSRKPKAGQISYSDLDGQRIKESQLIINTTPLGTYPDVDFCPEIPYEFLGPEHLLFDLVYNPQKTLFLKKGEARKAKIKNGLEMLSLQAEKSWEIWTSNPESIQKMKTKAKPEVNFTNTEIAFSSLSDSELKKKMWMFSVMNLPAVVNVGSKLGLLAFKLRLPVQPLIKTTLFDHFCGGRNLKECQSTIDRLWEHRVQAILDYGVEAKHSEDDFDETMNTTIKAIEFCKNNSSAPVVSTKITGLGSFDLLKKVHAEEKLSEREKAKYKRLEQRVDQICKAAFDSGNTGVFIDAEESWIQGPIDSLANLMMERYNKKKVFVYNTYQLYRRDRLKYLKDSWESARKNGYLLGAKLVRGAYLEKENARAKRLEYGTPMQPDKQSTDRDYNDAIRFCIDHYESIGLCAATHNEESCRLMVDVIEEKGLPRAHPHLNFCQLLGMSDHLSFNLGEAGYCVAKYVVYGPIRDVIPYLIRRAQENTAIAGGMSRELSFIKKEVKRRGL